MKTVRSLLLIALLLFCSSCSLFQRNKLLNEELEKRNEKSVEQLEYEENQRKLREQVMTRLTEIQELISSQKFEKAEKQLNELQNMEEYSAEMEELYELLTLARRLPKDRAGQDVDKQIIINEVSSDMSLPKNYNKTVVVQNNQEEKKVNELEELLDKPVSMKVTNMPLGELALHLKNLEGINIADPVNVIFNEELIKGKTLTANFKNVPLSEIFDYISFNLGVEFNIHGNIIWVTKSTSTSKGPRLITKTIQLKQGIIPNVPEGIGVSGKTAFESSKESDSDLEQALKNFYAKTTTGGSYVIFPQRNIIMVTDTLTRIREVERLVELFSKPPPQVVIEAKFITVSESDLHDVGVELTKVNGGKTAEEIEPNNQTNANISDFFTKLGVLAEDNTDGVSSMVISGILGNRTFDLLIRALEQKQSTVTLSAPRVTTLNNRTARIRKGDKLFYFEEYNLQTVDRGDEGKDTILVPTGKPANLPLGITFDVKPSIGADGRTILLGLRPEIATLLYWEDYTSSKTVTENKSTVVKGTEIKLPHTYEQNLATSVTIRSGETVILGGMVENKEETVVKKVPILGSIPLLGILFTHTYQVKEPTNLLIFVTATIINERGEYVIVNR